MNELVTKEYLDNKLRDYPTKTELEQILDRRFEEFHIRLLKEIREEIIQEQIRFMGAIREEWESHMKALKEGFQMMLERFDRYERENQKAHNEFDRRLLALE